MKRGRDVRRSPNSGRQFQSTKLDTQERTRKVMPNVGEKSPPDNWLDLHAASMDALVRGSAPARPYQPYPGDHPCSVCGSLLAFVAVGWPRRPQWFCRQHLEEFTCPTTGQPTKSLFSKPFAKAEPSVGDNGSGSGSETPSIPSNNGRWKKDLFD
jgi:hypothetical protein